jgi:hypothetical protein
MDSHLLRNFQLSTVFQILRDAGGGARNGDSQQRTARASAKPLSRALLSRIALIWH